MHSCIGTRVFYNAFSQFSGTMREQRTTKPWQLIGWKRSLLFYGIRIWAFGWITTLGTIFAGTHAQPWAHNLFLFFLNCLFCREYFYPSNLAPLWTDCYDKAQAQDISKSVLSYLDRINIMDFLGEFSAILH